MGFLFGRHFNARARSLKNVRAEIRELVPDGSFKGERRVGILRHGDEGRPYLDYRCKNPMDAGCPSGSTSSRRFPGGLFFS